MHNIIQITEQEGSTTTIRINSDDPDAVKAMLTALYTGDYEEYVGWGGDMNMAFHAEVRNEILFCCKISSLPANCSLKVYYLGLRYQIEPLQDLASRRFEAAAKFQINTPKFLFTIQQLYRTIEDTERRLQNILVKLAASNINKLLQNEDFCDMMNFVGEFGKDLAKYSLRWGMKKGTCQCGKACIVETNEIDLTRNTYYSCSCKH
jgi:hypothetical protein